MTLSNRPPSGSAALSPKPGPPRNKPAQEIRLGALKAVVWKNAHANQIRYNTTFVRIYKEQEQWKETDSFGRDDLLLLAKLADHVHSWILTEAPRSEDPQSP